MDTRAYDPMDNPRFRRLITKARQTNAKRDEGDRTNGWAAPSDTHPIDELRTGLAALEAGLGRNDWDCVAEGFLMIQQAEVRFRDFDTRKPGGGILLRDGETWVPKFS